MDIAVRYPGSRNGLLIGADGSEREIFGGERFIPTRTMIVLAESEIDYDDFDSAVRGGKRSGAFSKMTATTPRTTIAFEQCNPETDQCGGDGGGDGGGGSGGSVGGNQSFHSRMNEFAVNDDHDFPWGTMEIELFGNVGGNFPSCARYTGIEQGVLYVVSDTLDWRNDVATAIADSTTNFNLHGYEDDDGACVVNGGDDDLGTISFGPSGYRTFIYSSLGVTEGFGADVWEAIP